MIHVGLDLHGEIRRVHVPYTDERGMLSRLRKGKMGLFLLHDGWVCRGERQTNFVVEFLTEGVWFSKML